MCNHHTYLAPDGENQVCPVEIEELVRASGGHLEGKLFWPACVLTALELGHIPLVLGY